MPTPKKSSKPANLLSEMRELREEIVHIRQEYRRNNQTRRSLALSFLKGTTSALGAIAAVVIVMPAIVWALRLVEWPPIFSGFVDRVIQQIELSRQSPPAAVDQ